MDHESYVDRKNEIWQWWTLVFDTTILVIILNGILQSIVELCEGIVNQSTITTNYSKYSHWTVFKSQCASINEYYFISSSGQIPNGLPMFGVAFSSDWSFGDHLFALLCPLFTPFNSLWFILCNFNCDQCSFHFLLSFILSQNGFCFEGKSNIQNRHSNTPNSKLGFESMLVSTQIFIAIHSRLIHMMIQILYFVNNRNQRYCFDG